MIEAEFRAVPLPVNAATLLCDGLPATAVLHDGVRRLMLRVQGVPYHLGFQMLAAVGTVVKCRTCNTVSEPVERLLALASGPGALDCVVDHRCETTDAGRAVVRLRFGKHRGVPLDEVPDGYLVWLFESALAGTLEQYQPGLSAAVRLAYDDRFHARPLPHVAEAAAREAARQARIAHDRAAESASRAAQRVRHEAERLGRIPLATVAPRRIVLGD